MGEVLPWKPAPAEPAPTEAAQRCRCGHDQFKLWAYGTIACGQCGALQAARYQREGGND